MQEDWEKKKVTDGLTEKVQPIYMILPNLHVLQEIRVFASTLWDCVSMKNVSMYWHVEFKCD